MLYSLAIPLQHPTVPDTRIFELPLPSSEVFNLQEPAFLTKDSFFTQVKKEQPGSSLQREAQSMLELMSGICLISFP